MRHTALKAVPQAHWAAPRRIEPARGAFFTHMPAPAIVDAAMPVDHRRAIVRLLRAGLGINLLLWAGLALQAARLI